MEQPSDEVQHKAPRGAGAVDLKPTAGGPSHAGNPGMPAGHCMRHEPGMDTQQYSINVTCICRRQGALMHRGAHGTCHLLRGARRSEQSGHVWRLQAQPLAEWGTAPG